VAKDIVYFDLETQRTANDVGGWHRKTEMRMSVGVTYSTRDERYEIFSEDRAQALVDRLLRADLVVGYNVVNFDYAVLMRYTILNLPEELRTLDMLVDVEAVLGHKVKLDALALGTFGYGKTADGIDAIKWWRQGRVMEIAEYCCFDVKVTRLVHEYGARNRELFYLDQFARRQRLDVNWAGE